MTVFIERGRIARGTDNTYFVGPIHKSKLGSLSGTILPARRTPAAEDLFDLSRREYGQEIHDHGVALHLCEQRLVEGPDIHNPLPPS